MARWRGPVLIDTNVIIESWRTKSWRALAGGYTLETSEDCVTETQTGFQKRRPEQQIDRKLLLESLHAVHAVTDAEYAAAFLRDCEIAVLDTGEKSLWAHALGRADTWILCGPDKASLRIGLRLGFRDRLVCLEQLLTDAGFKPKLPLKTAYRREWLERALAEIAQREGRIA